MTAFWDALVNAEFIRHALLAGLLASLACGIIGTFVVVRRISFIAGGIAHTVLGGMGIAYFFGRSPFHGAVAAALLAALITGLINRRGREHEDTLISAMWSIGMAVGILFMAKTPGYNVDLMSFLFGNILLVGTRDLTELAVLDGGILVLVLLFYRQFRAVSYDPAFIRLRGVAADWLHLLLLTLIALTVVILIRVVGIILVIALLTLPAAVAQSFSRSLHQMMLLAAGFAALFTFSGLGLSYAFDLPSGAVIIVCAGAVYLLSELGRHQWRRWRARRQMSAPGTGDGVQPKKAEGGPDTPDAQTP